MTTYTLFDLAGPIMVGPSSSHTAGAARLGQFARAIFNAVPERVHFFLHGSFGEVYMGHATDRALLGGVMGFAPSDPRIKDAFELAQKSGLSYEFQPGDLGPGHHPNTVRITLENKEDRMEIIGSSIGGGAIEILQINGFDVHISGNSADLYFILIVENENQPGMLAKTTTFIGEHEIRIVNMQSCYLAPENKVLSVLSLEKPLSTEDLKKLTDTPGILSARTLSKLPS